ncbi:amidohydrolase family protein [Streptomyces sp. NPDC101160]|uniref:amidohydrolase family protein n=1 Tax=Streptomyces sp. NPDC101160 TaxID=3366118 RepID=UPI0037F70AE0
MNARYIDFRIRPADEATSVDLEGTDSEGYTRVYGNEFTGGRSLTHLIAEMETNDVIGVMQAEWEEGDPVAVNERVHRAVTAHPDRLVAGIATTDPRLPNALEILKHAHDDLGLRGWNFQPGFLKVAANDPIAAPLLKYCQENGHPVTVHSGINFSDTGPISFGHPSALCEIACAYPGLVIVASHGGWPWVTETLAVLWKHRNVYADFGAVAPKRMVGPKGGWEPVAHWMNTMVSDQVLLASDWPMMRHERLIPELDYLQLSEESYDKYTRGNAARLIDSVWGTRLVDQLKTGATS